VVDRVVREKGWQGVPRSRTAGIKLCGGEGYDAMLFVRLVQTFNISAEVAQHLAHTYGARAHEVCRLTRPTPKLWPRFGVPLVEGYPYLENEVEFAVRHEYALTVKDVLALRTRLAFLNSEAAKLAAPRVAHIMAPLLGWSEAQREQQLVDALAYMDCFGGPYPKQPASAPQPVAVADLRQLFHRLDHDGSGYLERSEVANAAKTLGLGDIASAQQLDALFDRLPGAQAGRVFENDFCAFFLENLDKDEVVKRVTAELKLSVDKLEDNARGVMFG
jgi:glycerol-3-phosphate dehydrogenase